MIMTLQCVGFVILTCTVLQENEYKKAVSMTPTAVMMIQLVPLDSKFGAAHHHYHHGA
jgi:hypothetical protein